MQLHRTLVGLYSWHPREVWELELFEALDYLDEAVSRRAIEMLMQAAAFLEPRVILGLVNEDEPTMTLEDEFGAEEAAGMRAAQQATLDRVAQLEAQSDGK